MKLAVITQYPADPASPHGGVEAVSVTLCDSLAKFDDIDLQVVTVERQRTAAQVERQGRLTIHRLPYLGGSVLANAIGRGRRQIHDYVRELSPDIIHAHDTYGLMTVGLTLPRVFTIHGFIYGDTLVSGVRFPQLRSKIWRRYETAGWANQPNIVSISPYVRERLSGIAKGTIYDIDNPVAERFFAVMRRPSVRPIVFSAALIEPRKNTLQLVESFAAVINSGVDADLRLAGRVTNPSYGEQIKSAIDRLGVSDKVHLLGSISSRQIEEELSRAAVFSLVSLEENSPIGIEEAMAVGVPVLASNRCGMPYMVRHGESGLLVNPLDSSDVAAKLRRLLKDEALREAMGAAGKQIALDRFHPDAVARRTRAVYLDALGMTGANRAAEALCV